MELSNICIDEYVTSVLLNCAEDVDQVEVFGDFTWKSKEEMKKL
jgi:hypothetical protein